MAQRLRIGRLLVAALAAGVAFGLLVPTAASAEPPPAVPTVHEDAIPPTRPGYDVTPLPRLAQVKARHVRLVLRDAEIRRDLARLPLERRIARGGRTVFALYETD